MTENEFIKRWIGTPWEDRAIGPDSVDCWGLVYLYFRDVLNVEVSKPSDHENIITGFQSEVESGKWKECEHPSEGLVFMSFRGDSPMHCGIVTSKRRVLHAPGSPESKNTVALNSIKAIQKVYGKCKFYKRVD